jgi:hypothetical protein
MIKIKVRNIDVVLKNLSKLKGDLPHYIGAANQEAAREILDTQGFRAYPPATAANQPPTPYYIRGRGTQYASKNLNNSERLGTRWATETYGQLGMKISNPVTYAQYVHGTEQAAAMGRIGWRILFDVAKEKIGVLTEIYTKWIDKLIKDSGL